MSSQMQNRSGILFYSNEGKPGENSGFWDVMGAAECEFTVHPAVLVIGGGEAAAVAAKNLIRQQPVVLVNNGNVPDVPEAISYANYKVTAVNGQAGRFTVSLQGPVHRLTVYVGGIVVALETGKAVDPALGLPQNPWISGLFQVNNLSDQTWRGRSVAILLGRESSSFKNTIRALELALELREKHEAEVEIFFQHMQAAAPDFEYLHQCCRRAGVKFHRYIDEVKVHVNVLGVNIQITDPLLPEQDAYKLLADFLLAGEIDVPLPETSELNLMLKTCIGSNGFFKSEKLPWPSTVSNRIGIHFVGDCHDHQVDLQTEVMVVAAQLAHYADGSVLLPQLQAVVDPEKCALCLTCFRICRHKAVVIDTFSQSVQVDPLACWACGKCVAECPAQALDLPLFSRQHLAGQLQHPGRLVVYACANSAYLAAEEAGLTQEKYKNSLSILQVPCAGRIDYQYIIRALQCGASGVLILSCPEGKCQSGDGNLRAAARLQRMRHIMSAMNMDAKRLQSATVTANSVPRLLNVISRMLATLEPTGKEGERE